MSHSPDRSEEILKRLPKALEGYMSQWPSGPVRPQRAHLYCGHLGDRTELEVQLWKLVESALDPSEEELLLRHTDDCLYCQTRIRDISEAMRLAMSLEPAPAGAAVSAPVAQRVPALIVRLKKVRRLIREAGHNVVADILVALELTGRRIRGQNGDGIVKAYAPIDRGLERGVARVRSSAEQGKLPSRFGGTICESFKIANEFGELVISYEIRSTGTHLDLLVGCHDKMGARPPGQFHVELLVDSKRCKETELDLGGNAVLQVPFEVACAEVRVYRQKTHLCGVTIQFQSENI